jgi:hypothetical protein
MAPLDRSFSIRVGNAEERVRVQFRQNRGTIERFTVQLELEIDGDLVPVVRWDTAHGFAHRDHLNRDGSTHHWDEMSRFEDFSASLTEAIADATDNEQRYRTDFIRRSEH